jgi:drug/metabolite transporter (DMT)-like permease
MPALLIGVLAALGASAVFALGMGLQTLEAREETADKALRLSLFARLIRRPRWLAGTALGILGWVGQAYALTKAPLTLVQPLLGTTLVFLLFVAVRQLDEHVGRREILAAVAVAGGVPLLAVTTPARHAAHSEGARLWITLAVLGVLTLVPLGLRGAARSASLLVPAGAGLAYALDSLATKFAADDYTRNVWLGLVGWLVLMGAAGLLGTLGEMSALQSRPVTHVAPLVLALTTFVPVALAPLLAHEWWPGSALRLSGLVIGILATGGGALALATVEPVGRVFSREASKAESVTGRSPRLPSEETSAATARSR